jgi:hypothetical protein
MTRAAGGPVGTRVTRDVALAAVRDLLEYPRRATVAFVDGSAVALLPVTARCRADTYLVGISADGSPSLERREVVLVIDDGPYWFELRGISVRGIAERSAPPVPAAAGLVWYAIEPRRVLAWDYGAIREE